MAQTTGNQQALLHSGATSGVAYGGGAGHPYGHGGHGAGTTGDGFFGPTAESLYRLDEMAGGMGRILDNVLPELL